MHAVCISYTYRSLHIIRFRSSLSYASSQTRTRSIPTHLHRRANTQSLSQRTLTTTPTFSHRYPNAPASLLRHSITPCPTATQTHATAVPMRLHLYVDILDFYSDTLSPLSYHAHIATQTHSHRYPNAPASLLRHSLTAIPPCPYHYSDTLAPLSQRTRTVIQIRNRYPIMPTSLLRHTRQLFQCACTSM